MSINKAHSLLHFLPTDIIDNANSVGVSLGNSSREVARSINDLLDLEVDRALDIVRNLASIKPMKESDINALGELNSLCENLAPTESPAEDEDHLSDDCCGDVQHTGVDIRHAGYMDELSCLDKPKCASKRKVYPVSAIRRSARFRIAKKFYDER